MLTNLGFPRIKALLGRSVNRGDVRLQGAQTSFRSIENGPYGSCAARPACLCFRVLASITSSLGTMDKHKLLRRYARAAGVGLVLLGMSGLVLNLPDSALVVDGVRLLTGFALLYAGLGRCRAWRCRAIVGGSGLLFLTIGMIVPAQALLSSAPITSYEGTEEALFWVVLGLLGLSVAALVGEDETPSPTSEENP